jgi:hypothetical protein
VTNEMTEESAGWTGGQRAFGDFAPGLVYYTDRVLFDEVWERPEFSKRDRSRLSGSCTGGTCGSHWMASELDLTPFQASSRSPDNGSNSRFTQI